jgi:DNA ligase-1
MKTEVSRRSAVGWAAGVFTGLSYWPKPWAQSVLAGVMLATPWPIQRDPSEYWVSEKLDGVRALWDGQALRFRSGHLIAAPQWFTAALPPDALDGELWLGRGSFERLSATVRRAQPVDAQWRDVRYMVFDSPRPAVPFADWLMHMNAVLAALRVPFLQAVRQFHVDDAVALVRQLELIVKGGGEGVVLHHPQAVWQAGRSDAVHKLKAVQDDEALVIGYVPGKGRHSGRVGAMLVEMSDGQRFYLGTGLSDAQRETPPQVGSWVTYRYLDRTSSGLPRFASFLRERLPE